MANRDIFESKRSSIPQSDPRVMRIDFEKEDMGARKSHLRTADKGKNGNTIVHVQGSGNGY